jgi:hypothetical protein
MATKNFELPFELQTQDAFLQFPYLLMAQLTDIAMRIYSAVERWNLYAASLLRTCSLHPTRPDV